MNEHIERIKELAKGTIHENVIVGLCLVIESQERRIELLEKAKPKKID